MNLSLLLMFLFFIFQYFFFLNIFLFLLFFNSLFQIIFREKLLIFSWTFHGDWSAQIKYWIFLVNCFIKFRNFTFLKQSQIKFLMSTDERTRNFILNIFWIICRFTFMIKNLSNFDENLLSFFADFFIRRRMRPIILMKKGKLINFSSVIFWNLPWIFFHFLPCIVTKLNNLF